MIIHEPVKSIEGDRLRFSAFIEVESRPDLSDTLWFDLPADQAAGVSAQSNAFAASVMVVAMALGEKLTVRGQLSPRLLSNLPRYQQVFNRWNPDSLKMVEVSCGDTAVEKVDRSRQVAAAAFSGGIDSFYTLLRHSAGTAEDIKMILLLGGFDIPLADSGTFTAVRSAYRQFASENGLTLVDLTTNFRETKFSKVAPWTMVGGCLLSVIAHILSPRIFRYYIAAGGIIKDGFPFSTSPEVDPLLSLDGLEVIHDNPLSRVDKTRLVAGDPRSYRYLRVCWENNDGINNCCRCQKCIRTMLTLDLLGVLGRYETFRLALPKNIQNWALYSRPAIAFAEEILDLALEKGESARAKDIERAIRRSRSTLATSEAICRRLGIGGESLKLAVFYGLISLRRPAIGFDMVRRRLRHLSSGRRRKNAKPRG